MSCHKLRTILIGLRWCPYLHPCLWEFNIEQVIQNHMPFVVVGIPLGQYLDRTLGNFSQIYQWWAPLLGKCKKMAPSSFCSILSQKGTSAVTENMKYIQSGLINGPLIMDAHHWNIWTAPSYKGQLGFISFGFQCNMTVTSLSWKDLMNKFDASGKKIRNSISEWAMNE